MKKLIIARHGSYGYNSLTSDGQIQIRKLAKEIKENFSDESMIILSSPVQRAVESSEIFSEIINVDFEMSEAFTDAHPGYERMQACEEVIENYKDNADIIIIVTHLPMLEALTFMFVKKYKMSSVNRLFNEFTGSVEKCELSCGDAWILDLEQKLIRVLSPIDERYQFII